MEDKKLTPQEKYDKENIVRYSLKINKKTDADILKVMEAAPNKQGLFKAAIRAYVNKGEYALSEDEFNLVKAYREAVKKGGN